jgi:signal transduction histidine kinase/DNA-binding response OmpR family regulator
MPATTSIQIYVIISDPQVNYLLERVLRSTGYSVTVLTDRASADQALEKASPELIILGERLSDGNGLDMAQSLRARFPAMPVLLFVSQDTPELLKAALRAGITEYICLPLRSEDILRAVQRSLDNSQRIRNWIVLEARRATASLQQQLSELEVMARLGRSITSSLDLDSVLSAIVDAAVELTGAEEGSLLLLDESTGELYMRASRNFQEDFVRTFRLPITDSLAGSVIKTGKPVILDDSTPQKIKTSYLVQGLLYVPLQIHGHVFGVLGVDNRKKGMPFTKHHIQLITTMAEYAVIAIENARLYSRSSEERQKAETILTSIQDGVLVIDNDGRIVLANPVVKAAFNLGDDNLTGKPALELFTQPELLELISTPQKSVSSRAEIPLQDGRVLGAQLTPIPEVGLAVTMSDITYLKKLDRIKSDFVGTVSHDLRSPLTAILGYVDLIDRVGTTNEMQKEFIRRVQVSVHNITALVDDLLNLGKIEAGFDARKEVVQLNQIIRYAVEELSSRAAEKNQSLLVELPEGFPPLFGNPIQLRQMVDNLLDNAMKYTPAEGIVRINGQIEGNQIILQIIDNGMGIPSVDLPYIFDKFFRASNVSPTETGTGLGLAIVKSIVENHDGRIWVESTVDQGSTFTIVLPVLEA